MKCFKSLNDLKMGLQSRKRIHSLSILAFFINFFDKSASVILTVDHAGQSLNSSGPILSDTGQKQCVRECMRRGDCLSVNYWRRDLRCQLNPSTMGPGVVLVPDPACVYMVKSTQPPEILSGPCFSTSCSMRCTDLSSGSSYCGPVISALPTTTQPPPTSPLTTTTAQTTTTIATTCPSNFKWDAFTNLCYFVEENHMTWQDANNYCQSLGARLAILDTPAKLDLISNDYMSAQIMYFEYFIGGSFDDMVLDWKWVNGSIIDPNYLMNYPVSGGPGACLIWSDIYYLYDYPCSITIPAICDIPLTTSSAMPAVTAPTTTTIAPACPSNFRWDASTNLCYFVEENPMTWQNANTHCQSLGARLAILDTQAKLNLILNDYMSAQIMYFEYFIGGSFDDMVLDWKWVNGSIIDSNYLMNYPVSGGPGACLIWSEIHYLYDYPCSISIPAICDIPMTTSSVSTCPSNYRWDSTVYLCYLVEESPRIWQDAKAYCESIGARLAILDTSSKLDLILSDYISGTLMHLDYFIGASFDTGIMDWRWVNGSAVDSGFLMNYPVAGGGSDDCLVWSDVAYLVDFPCSLSQPFICEIQVSP
ncbi:lymphocyte antigen 75-like [Crassostrea angulata]|uniref:lymphocyte antigen 75-like n=1 Tax=Magallana angulata TaxID=2784310 RepID=UPI0022B15C90|nr:lymphocyte antigen 75-like [Crassostrea angulata]